MERQRRHDRVDRTIHVAPGPGGEVEGSGLKTPAEPGQPFLRSLEHLDGTVEPVHGVRGESVEDGFGEQPFTAAQLDDGARAVEAGDQVDDDLQLPLAFGDKVPSIVDERLGCLLVPAVFGCGVW